MQFKLTAAANIPIVLMNSSTGIPLRTVTFLKTSSAICGFGSCASWPVTSAVASRHTVNIPATLRIVCLDPNLMVVSFFGFQEDYEINGGQYTLGWLLQATVGDSELSSCSGGL